MLAPILAAEQQMVSQQAHQSLLTTDQRLNRTLAVRRMGPHGFKARHNRGVTRRRRNRLAPPT